MTADLAVALRACIAVIALVSAQASLGATDEEIGGSSSIQSENELVFETDDTVVDQTGYYVDDFGIEHFPAASVKCMEALESETDKFLLIKKLQRCYALDDENLEARTQLAGAYADIHDYQNADYMLSGLLEEAIEIHDQIAEEDDRELYRAAISDYIIMQRNRKTHGPEVAAAIFYQAVQAVPWIGWRDTMQVPPSFDINPSLTAKPWWDDAEKSFPKLAELQAQMAVIQEELRDFLALGGGDDLALESDHSLVDEGDWSEYILWEDGEFDEEHCVYFMDTCSLLADTTEVTGWPIIPHINEDEPSSYDDADLSGQATILRLKPGTHLRPHTGPANDRLTVHVPLIIPEGVVFRVANESRGYDANKLLVFDDSFEHEVWHNGKHGDRYVLYLTVPHPGLHYNLTRGLDYDDQLEEIDELYDEADRDGVFEPLRSPHGSSTDDEDLKTVSHA